MAIVPTDVPMTAELCRRTLQALAQQYPSVRLRDLGRTAHGRLLQLLTLGVGEREVLYTAAFHANEWITATVLLRFAEELARAAREGTRLLGTDARQLLDRVTIHMVPMVNPDGVDLVTGALDPESEEYAAARTLAAGYPEIPFPDGWKANLDGVDLNLQFPALWRRAREIKFAQGYTRPGPRDYVGRAPLNQPESRALAALTEELDPALVLAYHSQGRVIYWQFRDYEVAGAEELGRIFAEVSGYTLEDTPYASSFAGFKDWFIQEWRRPGYTVEVGQGENPLPISQFGEIYRDNRGILLSAALGLPGEEDG